MLKLVKLLQLLVNLALVKLPLRYLLMRTNPPSSGSIYFENQDVTNLSEKALKDFRKKVQMVFQDPYSSLDPRMTVAKVIG